MKKLFKKTKKFFFWVVKKSKALGPIVNLCIAITAVVLASKSNEISAAALRIAQNSDSLAQATLKISSSTDSLTKVAVSLAKNDSILQANDSTQLSILNEQQKLYQTSQFQLKELMDVSNNIYAQSERMRKEDKRILHADSVRFFQSLKSVYDSLEYFTYHIPVDSIVTTEFFKNRIKNVVGRCIMILQSEVANRHLLQNQPSEELHKIIYKNLDRIYFELHIYSYSENYSHENFYFLTKLTRFTHNLSQAVNSGCKDNLADCLIQFKNELKTNN